MTGRVLDLGRMGYLPAWERQKEVHEEVVGGAPDTLIFVEHDPVFTLGANFHPENLLEPVEEYERRGIEVHRTDRGGDVTYHGPGQLVVYPIFDIARHGRDLHRWMRDLEETMLETARSFGLEPRRFPPHTGAWVGDRKLASIGIKARRWVSLHGIALNCDNDMTPFTWIIPCGIADHPMTSLSLEASRPVGTEEAKPAVAQAFAKVFGLEF
ncbi:MAG: lipoyl(octanoyl) transferase LipB [Fimbriimonadaceae bacterium]|nr:lipoyl(octanoyl) transferase LipB [Fimbriimonadaceae bacterium]